MHNGWRLAHGSIYRRWRHMQVRGDHDGRRLGLELAWRHGILRRRQRRRLLVGVPLLHLLYVLGIALRRAILLLELVVLRIGVVVYRRMRLRGNLVVVLLLGLPAPRYIRARHHEQQ